MIWAHSKLSDNHLREPGNSGENSRFLCFGLQELLSRGQEQAFPAGSEHNCEWSGCHQFKQKIMLHQIRNQMGYTEILSHYSPHRAASFCFKNKQSLNHVWFLLATVSEGKEGPGDRRKRARPGSRWEPAVIPAVQSTSPARRWRQPAAVHRPWLWWPPAVLCAQQLGCNDHSRVAFVGQKLACASQLTFLWHQDSGFWFLLLLFCMSVKAGILRTGRGPSILKNLSQERTIHTLTTDQSDLLSLLA